MVGKRMFHASVKKKGPSSDPKSMLRNVAILGICDDLISDRVADKVIADVDIADKSMLRNVAILGISRRAGAPVTGEDARIHS